MIRSSAIITVIGFAVLLAACASAPEESATGRPNIIFILADDLGWSDIGPYGSEVATPNLDRLAAEGLRFTQFHNTSKCFPSRAILLTGLYAQQIGMDKRAAKIVNGVTIGEVLRPAGYRTYWSGKHHSTENPFDRGFDHYYGLRDGACNYFNPGEQRPGEGKPAQKRPDRAWCIDDQLIQPYTPPAGFYTTDYFTNYALEWLEEDKDDERPFFLYMAYNAPHDPLMAWPEDIAKYRGKYKAGYETIRAARYERQKQSGLIDDSFPLSEATHRPWAELSDEEKDEEDLKMAVYAAMIDRMDRNIGRILDKVAELGQEENTIVMFASDNGASAEDVTRGFHIPGDGEIGTMERWTSLKEDWANVGNTPYRLYKNYSHEGGICTPFIVHWPAKIKNGGAVTHYPGHFIDVMPTILELAGAEYPATFNGQQIHPLPGESLLPVIEEGRSARATPIFFNWRFGRAIRKDNWKLVSHGRTPEETAWELYDTATDKTETNNLAPENPELVESLAREYDAWLEEVTQPAQP